MLDVEAAVVSRSRKASMSVLLAPREFTRPQVSHARFHSVALAAVAAHSVRHLEWNRPAKGRLGPMADGAGRRGLAFLGAVEGDAHSS